MNKPKLAFGLNLTKKAGTSKPLPARGRSMFNVDDDDGDDDGDALNRRKASNKAEDIGGDFDDFAGSAPQSDSRSTGPRSRREIPKEPPKLKARTETSAMFGDLSSSLASRKHAETAAELDGNVYEYDAIYDSMKPKRTKSKEDEERKPKYMRSLLQAADVRKRDALIAEEKKIAREREAEGDEFAGKEKFVTEGYKRQLEENRRIEEAEKRQEEEEAKKNQGGGMTAFYRRMLNKDEERHAETLKAADIAERAPRRGDDEDGGGAGGDLPRDRELEEGAQKTEADLARELNDQGASIAVNEDGQVVDKRQLLKGGLNVGAKKKEAVEREAPRPADGERQGTGGMRHDKKQAMRERQSRMMEEQLEQSLKRTREEEQARREEVERNAKSRKTEGEISSAKERYLARKKAAEEEKKAAAAGRE